MKQKLTWLVSTPAKFTVQPCIYDMRFPCPSMLSITLSPFCCERRKLRFPYSHLKEHRAIKVANARYGAKIKKLLTK